MNRDDIIKLAREIATQCCNRSTSWQHDYAMTRIMELIDASIAAEREECAEFLMRGVDLAGLAGDPVMQKYTVELLIGLSTAIRARGSKQHFGVE